MLRRLRIENLVLIREADLAFGPGLNAVTGETGAGKTIFAQAIGLLLGARADASSVGADGGRGLRRGGARRAGRVLRRGRGRGARGAPARGRGRARARPARVRRRAHARLRLGACRRARGRRRGSRAAGRDVGAVRAAPARAARRSSSTCSTRSAGPSSSSGDARHSPPGASSAAARRRHEELTRDADAAAARLAELEALVEDTEGLEPGDEEALKAQRERLRHVAELEEAAAAATEAISPEEGDGAASLAVHAERALAPLERIAPELGAAATELRDVAVRLREVGSDLHAFLASLDADPGALDEVEGRLARIADLQRRFGCASYDELLERAAAARAELEQAAAGHDPVTAAAEAVAAAEARVGALAEELRAVRRSQARPLSDEVAAELQGLGMGEGEFLVELREREPGATGADEVAFLVRPNAGLPFAPVAETASGGELSRIALALAAVAGGETLVFDEIDAGIGGVTAHAVAATLQRLAERAQVLTITHLPQIASVAERHFRVEKVPGDPTHTRIEELDDLLRREELERMAGGAEFIATLKET